MMIERTAPKQQRPGPGWQNGVTLIELMIVVVIIGILSAIAYPNYTAYVQRGNRAEARSVLLEAAQFMERSYTMNNCYHRNDGACGTAGVNLTLPASLAQSPKSGTAKYNIGFSVQTAQAYTLQAVPTGVMTGDACGNLTLDSTGIKGRTGTLSLDQCWGK